MVKHKILYIFTLCIYLTSCTPVSWQIIKATSTKIPIDNKTEVLADKNYDAYLMPIKQKVGQKMNVVIGQATETMRGHAPESLLSNLSADVYRLAASNYIGQAVDIAVVNLGGLRTVINAGDITVGKVFELMPFENELVIVWLKGSKVMELLQYFASVGGEGVSGMQMEINGKKAIKISIGNMPLNPNNLYSIATNDYLAGGNDKMVQLAQNEKRVNTGIKIRDLLLAYIKNETKKGNPIQSKLDGRIIVLKQ